MLRRTFTEQADVKKVKRTLPTYLQTCFHGNWCRRPKRYTCVWFHIFVQSSLIWLYGTMCKYYYVWSCLLITLCWIFSTWILFKVLKCVSKLKYYLLLRKYYWKSIRLSRQRPLVGHVPTSCTTNKS